MKKCKAGDISERLVLINVFLWMNFKFCYKNENTDIITF